MTVALQPVLRIGSRNESLDFNGAGAVTRCGSGSKAASNRIKIFTQSWSRIKMMRLRNPGCN
jgi:hypothetical protein